MRFLLAMEKCEIMGKNAEETRIGHKKRAGSRKLTQPFFFLKGEILLPPKQPHDFCPEPGPLH